MKRIVVLLPWFGPWPAWMQLFLESCRWNPTVDFVLITDATGPLDFPENVRVVATSLPDLLTKVSAKLKIKLRWSDPYKVCELRPAFGVVFDDVIKGYDYWGFADVDVIFGDIRSIYTDEVLTHDFISTHEDRVSGHFFLIKNTEAATNVFRKIIHWRWFVCTAKPKSFDERIFSLLFLGEEGRRARGVHRFLASRVPGALLKERFSTPLEELPWVDDGNDFPKRWFWRNGKITADNTGSREFLYLHFTGWQSKRWTGTNKAVWDGLDRVVKVEGPRPTSFAISANGFEPIALAPIAQHA